MLLLQLDVLFFRNFILVILIYLLCFFIIFWGFNWYLGWIWNNFVSLGICQIFIFSVVFFLFRSSLNQAVPWRFWVALLHEWFLLFTRRFSKIRSCEKSINIDYVLKESPLLLIWLISIGINLGINSLFYLRCLNLLIILVHYCCCNQHPCYFPEYIHL